MRRHVQGVHLPVFFREGRTSSRNLRAFLAFISLRLQLGGIKDLLRHVRQHGFHPRLNLRFSAEDLDMGKDLSRLLGEAFRPEELTTNPPSCAAALLHWRVLACLISHQPKWLQVQLKCYNPPTGQGMPPAASPRYGRTPTLVKRMHASEPHSRPRTGPPSSQEVIQFSKHSRAGQRTPTATATLSSVAVSSSFRTPRSEEWINGFDSHFHLDRLLSETKTSTLDEAIAGLPQAEPFRLKYGVAVFCDPLTWPLQSSSRLNYRADQRLYFAYGVHPKSLQQLKHEEEDLESLDALLGTMRAVALGEVGIDYTRQNTNSPQEQARLLRRFLPLADRRRLPVVIHCRDNQYCEQSARDCLQILKDCLRPTHVIHRHCFNGSLREFREWQAAFSNCYFGFTGLITDLGRRHPDTPAVLKEVSRTRVLLETDSPYLVPKGRSPSSKTNTPALLRDVAVAMGHYRNVPTSSILEMTCNNARRCYHI
jgi:TatD DNase family protein